MVLYVPIGLYCELSSLLDNSETFVTFCKTKLAYTEKHPFSHVMPLIVYITV